MGFAKIAAMLTGKDTAPYLSVDIGSSAIKVLSLDISGARPRLIGAGIAPTPAQAISNYTITKPDAIARVIRNLIESNELVGSKIVFAIPGTCAFTKKVPIAASSLKELDNIIAFEAGNYIPNPIDAVKLDYQVLRGLGKNSMEVLLVAVKNEIVSSYVNAIELAGLEPSIADIDHYALQNMFEVNYPEVKQQTVALVNVGARYSSVSILQKGEALFSGDVGVGGRLYTDSLCEAVGMKPTEAEMAKTGVAVPGYDETLIVETRDRTTEHIAGELHRQLGFFWNAAATDRSIEQIYLTGGSSTVPGLIDELSARTGITCELVSAFKEVDWSDNFDEQFVDEISSSMGVGVGLALRRMGDKKHAVN